MIYRYELCNIELHDLLWLIQASNMANMVNARRAGNTHPSGAMLDIMQQNVHRFCLSVSGSPVLAARKDLKCYSQDLFTEEVKRLPMNSTIKQLFMILHLFRLLFYSSIVNIALSGKTKLIYLKLYFYFQIVFSKYWWLLKTYWKKIYFTSQSLY